MTELLTAAQMRAIETAAIESGEVTGLELMERAGQGVVEAIFEEWPELAATSHRAVVLCGPGNNGGDGFVVARLLKGWGWEVEVFLYGDAEKLPPDALVNYQRWKEMGEVQPFEDSAYEEGEAKNRFVDLFIDALLGTGQTRGAGFCATLFHFIEDLVEYNSVPSKVVSIDVPTGLDVDSGKALSIPDSAPPHVVLAHLTVTFHSRKPGHLLGNGSAVCGKLQVVDIGLSQSSESGSISRKSLIERHGERRLGRGVCQLIGPPFNPRPIKSVDQHKYTHGHALILSGSPGKTGAARLAARGALRIGAGLVTIGVPPSAQMEVASHITAIMLKRTGDAEALTAVLEDSRINALCLGPGMGVERAAELLPAALASGRSCVLDADALSAIAQDAALFAMLHENCVLTPHAGEFARLFPDIAKRLRKEPKSGPAYSKVDATREAAKQAGCVVLFKGADTVIAAPNGRCSINSAHYDRAAPWLATAGSGDVLAGFITGLLARGFTPLQAAETAAWLHVECALSFGPGLIAEDISEELPKVFRKLDL